MLTDAPEGWAASMLQVGEVAVTADAGGLEAIAAAARTLDRTAIPVLRGEATPQEQEQTTIAHAGTLALIWVSPAFSDDARRWAEERGPMTLLVAADAALADDERRRIERFVALLSGQAA